MHLWLGAPALLRNGEAGPIEGQRKTKEPSKIKLEAKPYIHLFQIIHYPSFLKNIPIQQIYWPWTSSLSATKENLLIIIKQRGVLAGN